MELDSVCQQYVVADVRPTAEEMDELRQRNVAYEYLCHLEEAKMWLEGILKEQLPPTTTLEENLRNGVYLARLGHILAPEKVPLSRIYDIDQRRYRAAGLQFRHTDNIIHWLKALEAAALPVTFHPETTDIYEKKNMPRVIYCIHALSTHLFKLGKAPQMQDMYGKVNFTDDEINDMKAELKKSGIKMPAFQKIDGLLADNVEGDMASLHAAIVTINSAIDTKDASTLVASLSAPAAKLNNVLPEHGAAYLTALQKARQLKVEGALNRSLNDSCDPDDCDDLLSQAEIQGHLNKANVYCTWKRALDAAKNEDVETLRECLYAEYMDLKDISSDRLQFYMDEVVNAALNEDLNLEASLKGKEILQRCIMTANAKAEQQCRIRGAVGFVNSALDNGTWEDLYAALKNPVLQLSVQISKFAVPLYYEEMKIDKLENGLVTLYVKQPKHIFKDIRLQLVSKYQRKKKANVLETCFGCLAFKSEVQLTHDEIKSSVQVLSQIASVTQALDAGSVEETWKALSNPKAHFSDLNPESKTKYWRALSAWRKQKLADRCECSLLTYIDIQDCIDAVNKLYEDENIVIYALHKLNQAVKEKNEGAVIQCLQIPALKFSEKVSPGDSALYLDLLHSCWQSKQKDGTELWLDDVDIIVSQVNEEILDAQNACLQLSKINMALKNNNVGNHLVSLDFIKFHLNGCSKELLEKCFEAMKKWAERKDCQFSCPWVVHYTRSGCQVYINVEKCIYSWSKPQDMLADTCYLNQKEIETIISKIKVKYDAGRMESWLIPFQARIRGFLVRKKYGDRIQLFCNNVDSIIKIQAWWRSVSQRRKYLRMIAEKTHSKEQNTKLFHSSVWNHYEQQLHKIIKIQALWRQHQARKAFISLFQQKNPPFSVVKSFARFLDFSAEDYERDLSLQKMKNEVVQTIRLNQHLSHQLDVMDVKIGLLVHNRIALQDVVAHGTSLNDLAKQHKTSTINHDAGDTVTCKGLKSLTKEGRRLLDGYQHLFYFLQTNPNYLAKLIFCLPTSKTTSFLESVIFTLYSFGSHSREEYLLLKLFKSALEEEIRCKFTSPTDAVTGNPLVLKMVVNYSRQFSQNALTEILGPLILKVLKDKNISIETNPVDIYKCWRNQTEMQTGVSSKLPHSVSQEQALKYPEVQTRLNNSIQTLKRTTLSFLQRITQCRNIIPYSMLYAAKVLRNTLMEKFPKTAEKEILKVVGNLIYYHFINSAIVAPDAFDIITLSPERVLSNDQRRNLASIAKILQFAASKKGFGEESQHLMCLNSFIIECHDKFKTFFRECCEVEELEDHFNIHEYTEATLISRPIIYITVQEICDTHDLLLKYEDYIAPDPLDPLHELLEDLGPVPSVASLLGNAESALPQAPKTEMCLTLVNKFEIPEGNVQDVHELFIRTKELLVFVLPCLQGNNLMTALMAPSTAAQEQLYQELCTRCRQQRKLNQNCNEDLCKSLQEYKGLLKENLYKLELAGLVSQEDGYQKLISSIAQDICFKSRHREIRRKELQTLRSTRESLEKKRKFYEEQIDYYNQYIQKCLENLNAGKRSIHSLKSSDKQPEKLKSKLTLRYSASKLHEKGVLIEIEGLSSAQYKNTMFEICPTEHNGVFTIRGKFMGVEVEKIDIDIQDLLQLQFEGVSIMDIFGKAKVNVNLLLFLLNSKFYGKK